LNSEIEPGKSSWARRVDTRAVVMSPTRKARNIGEAFLKVVRE
jgi:hypothetical protein